MAQYQEGQTATNPQTGEKVVFSGGAWQPASQPSAPTFIPGTVSPTKQAAEQRAVVDQGLQVQAAERAAAVDARSAEAAERERKKFEAAFNPDGTPKIMASDAVGEERKAAAFLIRGLGANDSYEKQNVGPRSMVGQALADTVPGLLNSLPAEIGNSPQRQVADTNQDEFIAASLRQDSGAAIPEEEMERQRRIYFPMPGDGPEVIEAKRQARIRALEGLRQSAGRLEQSAEQRYAELSGVMPQNAAEAGLAPGAMAGPQEELYKGEATKLVASPVAAEYRRRLGAGESAEQITAYLRSAGVDFPGMEEMARGQTDFRKKYPRVPLDKYPISINNEVEAGLLERGVAAARTSPIATYFMNAGDVLTGNNLDSAAALVGGNPEVARQNMAATNAANPKSAILGQISGATMNALGAEAGLARMGVAGGLGRTAGANALAGGYEGLGGTDYNSEGGQASFGDRVMGGVKQGGANALAGAVATGAFRGAGAVVSPVGRAAQRSVGADPDVAIRQVGRALSEDGLTPRQAAAKISEAQSRGVPMSMADVGDNTRELLASVGRSRGEARSVVKTVIANRQRDQLERISSAVRRDLGPTANLREVGDELIARAKDEASPLYQMAFDAPGAGAVSEKIAPILGRPSAKKAMVRARRLAEEEGRDPTALGFDLNAQGEVVLTRTPSWETLHYIKTGMDDVIETYRDKVTDKLVLDAEGRLINNTKNSLLRLMDEYNPPYAAARQAYAGPVQLNDAMQLGSKAFSMAPDDVAAQIKSLNPSEMEMYRLGLRKGITDLLGSKGDYADKIKVLVGTPKSRAVLSKVLGGKPEFDRFMKTLSDEQELFRTYNAVSGNSATAGRQAFDETTTGENIASQAVDMLQAGKQGGMGGMVAAGAEKVIKAGQLGAGKAGDQARADIARLLAESDPDTLAQIAKMANRANAKARMGQRKKSISGARAGTVGGAIAGALGQGTSPGQ